MHQVFDQNGGLLSVYCRVFASNCQPTLEAARAPSATRSPRLIGVELAIPAEAMDARAVPNGGTISVLGLLGFSPVACSCAPHRQLSNGEDPGRRERRFRAENQRKRKGREKGQPGYPGIPSFKNSSALNWSGARTCSGSRDRQKKFLASIDPDA